jgi:hypothetical protein
MMSVHQLAGQDCIRPFGAPNIVPTLYARKKKKYNSSIIHIPL